MSIQVENKGIHIAKNPALYETAKSNAFDLIITGVSQILPAGVYEEIATQDDYLTGVQDVLRIAVDKASVPNFSITPIEVQRANMTIKFAGKPSFDAGSIVLDDFVGARVKDIILALKAQVYDVNRDIVHLASNYKHDWTLVEYNGDYSKVLRTWTLEGAWISDTSEGEFSHEDDGKRQITATVQYDRAVYNMEK